MRSVSSDPRLFRLSKGERTKLGRDLGAKVDRDGSRYSLHLVHADEDAALLSLQNTGDIFGQAFGNDPAMLALEYSDTIPYMTHLVVLDSSDAVVGSTSFIHRKAELNKTFVDVSKKPWNVPVSSTLAALDLNGNSLRSWDIATMAVTEKHRSGRLSLAMLKAGAFVAQPKDIAIWTAILDSASSRGFRQALGPFTKEIPGTAPQPYLGSKWSAPLYWGISSPAEVVSTLPWMNPNSRVLDVVLDDELRELEASYFDLATEAIDLRVDSKADGRGLDLNLI